MNSYTYRITQTLQAFYEGEVTIEAKSEKAAKNKLNKMTTKEIDDMAENWTQNTDEAEPIGEITVHDLI